jgi:hypothetical protein
MAGGNHDRVGRTICNDVDIYPWSAGAGPPFRFAYVDSEANAQGAERYLYEHYKSKLKLCNDRVPPAEPIEVNLT